MSEEAQQNGLDSPAAPQQKAEAEASREEQQRIGGLASEGLLLVDAALAFGHEGLPPAHFHWTAAVVYVNCKIDP